MAPRDSAPPPLAADRHGRGPGDPGFDWHALGAAEACARLGLDPGQGLDTNEAAERLRAHGPNRLAERPARPAWQRFLDQFRNVLAALLGASSLLTAAIGDLRDAAAILAVVVINAVLGYRQEARAERTLAALKGMLAQRVRVRRAGQALSLDADVLVPGDVVLLEAGERIPADGRFIVAINAAVDESALTGESRAVDKGSALLPPSLPLPERSNMGFMNTSLVRGRAEMLVTATGMDTETGRIALMLQDSTEDLTPLQFELDRVGKRLAAVAVAIIAVILGAGLGAGRDITRAVVEAVALAVAAIPEGLPAVVTLTLALGMYRMARHKALVRRLAAVETLGATTVICSDKTGTLTLNQMTARRVFFAGRLFQVSAEGGSALFSAPDGPAHPDFAPLLRPLALCSDCQESAGRMLGDPTEAALLALAIRGGMKPDDLRGCWPRIAEIPFDSSRKYMATCHRQGDTVLLLAKGAPEALLPLARFWNGPAGEAELDEDGRRGVEAGIAELAGTGHRVLAVATRNIPIAEFDAAPEPARWLERLTFQGLVGLQDPPRPEARQAIALCRQAGIRVQMITGDHAVTAAAIARELGLEGAVMQGTELDTLDHASLVAAVERTAVFARAMPEHKLRIVAALKAAGHVVAMTGDGVNDAPALKAADIGIAMGKGGTEVAREAAAMVLADDNFATIVRAVEEGRAIFGNIVKFVRFQLATNVGALLTVSAATFLGLPPPFTPIQILWINIIMDGPPAMTLGVDPPPADAMRAAPRRRTEAILSRERLGRVSLSGLVMALGTLAVFIGALDRLGSQYALTLSFTTFVLYQVFNALNSRIESGSVFSAYLFANRSLWGALAAMLLLQALAVHWGPAQAVFQTTALAPADWLLALAVASTVLWIGEAQRLLQRIRPPRGAAPE